MNLRKQLYIAFVVSLMLLACEQRQAGGTITEPFAMADIELQVSTQSQAKAYLFDIQSPYTALDSTEETEEGKLQFQSQEELPEAFRILIQSQDAGLLLDTIERAALPSDWEGEGLWVLDQELEAYELDTLTLTGIEEGVEASIQAAFEPYGKGVTEGQVILQTLPNQETWVLQTPADTLVIQRNDESYELLENSNIQISSINSVPQSEAIALDFRLASQVSVFNGKSATLSEDESGVLNQSVLLDSTVALFAAPSELVDANFYSVDLWIRPNCPDDCGIMGTNENRNMMIIGNRLQASTQTDQGMDVMTSNEFLNNGTWYHLVYQYRQGELAELYIDGVLSTLGVVPISTSLAYPTLIQVGRTPEMQSVLPDIHFKGEISKMRLWNRPLTSLEITDLYQGILPNS